MKVLGALESAQIEWFTSGTKPAPSSYAYRVIYTTDTKQILVSDGTNWLPSNITFYTSGTLPAAGSSNAYQVAFITDTFQVRVSNGTVWTTIGARLDTYTSGTIPAAASNTNQLIWVSDLQQVQVSNGTAWVAVGATSGLKNYFSQNNANPNFETNSVTPWSACTLTFSSGVPSGAPTLTATQMSIATTASTPLAGTYSMQLTKAAANAQYQGFISGALTIDREDTAKVLYGSFSYEVISGTVDFSGTSTQTYEIWIYNTVSGAWTQPAGYLGMNQSSGVGKVTFSFQTDGSTANNSYKIAVITQQTGTGAIVVKFDSFQIGPSAIILGAVVTDWQSYTPTFTGFGTPTGVSFLWKRVGDDIEIEGKFTSGTTTAVEARISLPNGLTSADTNKIPSIQTAGVLNFGVVNTTGQYMTLMEPSVNYFTLSILNTGLAGLTKINGNTATASGNVVVVTARIPIQGWSSNVQISSDTDTRVVAARYTTASGSTGGRIQFNTKDFDSHAAVTTGASWVYTAPVSGIYDVSSFIASSGNMGQNALSLVKNASINQTLMFQGVSSSNSEVDGRGLIQLNAGDTIYVQVLGSSVSITDGWIAINRLSGPSVIAATESVSAIYQTSAGQSIPNNTATVVVFGTKVYDSHGAMNSSTGVFTCPISGEYQVSGGFYFATAITATATDIQFIATKNGSSYLGVNNTKSGTAGAPLTTSGTIRVRCNAGDTLSVSVLQTNSASSAQALLTNATFNWVSISRVGN